MGGVYIGVVLTSAFPAVELKQLSVVLLSLPSASLNLLPWSSGRILL